MEVVFVVYHDLKTEARSQEMLQLLKMYGHVTLVSYCQPYPDEEIDIVCNVNENKSLFQFINNAVKTIKTIKPQMVMLHDAYPMVLVPLIRRVVPNCVIIHDSSELRLLTEKTKKTTLKMKIARLALYAERKYSQDVDVTIAANHERALIMKDYLNLKRKPLVFDNMHKIETDYDTTLCQEKFDDILKPNSFRVLYAGGIAEKRQTYKIAREIGNLGDEYQLIIVGSKENNGEEKLKNIMTDELITNVEYLGFVSREELKYLMEKCHITVSTFAMDTVNNINCASGKVYEGLFLGKPLLAGVNPPLKHLCETYGVGVSTEDFGEGCKTLKSHYQEYGENVIQFIEKVDYQNRINVLKAQIDSLL